MLWLQIMFILPLMTGHLFWKATFGGLYRGVPLYTIILKIWLDSILNCFTSYTCIMFQWDSSINTYERFGCNFQRLYIRNVWHACDDGYHYDVTNKCGVTITTGLLEWTLTFSEIPFTGNSSWNRAIFLELLYTVEPLYKGHRSLSKEVALQSALCDIYAWHEKIRPSFNKKNVFSEHI